MSDFLSPTEFLDYHDPKIQEYLAPIRSFSNKTEQAIALYYKVRDGFLYDPYHLDLRPKALASSTIIGNKRAWCVEKAIVLASGLRALGIPSKLGYSIVENHIGIEKLSQILQSNKIVFHGYVSVFIQEKWQKITPAFDKNICRLARVEPLEWQANSDALLQAFQGKQKFMEYHHDYGDFEDVPVQLMNDEMKKHYPHLFKESFISTKYFSFYHL